MVVTTVSVSDRTHLLPKGQLLEIHSQVQHEQSLSSHQKNWLRMPVALSYLTHRV